MIDFPFISITAGRLLAMFIGVFTVSRDICVGFVTAGGVGCFVDFAHDCLMGEGGETGER